MKALRVVLITSVVAAAARCEDSPGEDDTGYDGTPAVVVERLETAPGVTVRVIETAGEDPTVILWIGEPPAR